MKRGKQKRTIFVEGKTDVTFLRALGVSKKRISRSGDRGKVCNDVRNSICVIGLVDEDPNKKPSEYYREHTVFVKDNHNIKLRWDKDKSNYFVIICKNLEDWLLFITKNTTINIGKLFGFEKRPNSTQLHRAILNKPQKFEILANQLVAEQLKPILYLKELLDQ